MIHRKQLHANNASTTLSSTVAATDTTIVVSNGTKFPQPASGEFFLATLDNGAAIEIIEVGTRVGNTFSNCVRGREGTVAQSFSSGTRIENRVTASTLAGFARLIDRNGPASTLSELEAPEKLNSNSYLISETDDSGAPVLALSSGLVWKFPTFPNTVLSHTLASVGTKLKVSYTDVSNFAWLFKDRAFIIQFTSGNNRGVCRYISLVTATEVSWVTALPFVPQIGDKYEIYQSIGSSLSHTLPLVTGSTAGDTPTVAELQTGEVSINTNEAYLYTKKADGTIGRIGTTADRVSVTASGSLAGGDLQTVLVDLAAAADESLVFSLIFGE